MAKHARKVATAMVARANAHNGYGPNQNNKHTGKRPGSQNRKKAGFKKTPKR